MKNNLNMFNQEKPRNISPLVTAVFGVCFSVFSACVTVTEGGGVAPNPEKAARANTALAAEYIKQNNLDAAQRKALKAIEIDSDFAPAYNIMAVILQREGSAANLKKAESYFKKAIDKQDNYSQAHNNYGVYLSQLKRYEDAKKQFEIAGAALGYAGRASALENLGRTAMQTSDYKTAERALKQALSVNKNSIIARVELVDIYLKRQQYDVANTIYKDYLNYLGNKRQGSRSIMQGILLASFLKDGMEFKRLSSILKSDYPNSHEADKFRSLFPSE